MTLMASVGPATPVSIRCLTKSSATANHTALIRERDPLLEERLLGVHEVLDQLKDEDELKARIVTLRFFGGLQHEEIAALLEIGESSVRRHWSLAKVWLYDALHRG